MTVIQKYIYLVIIILIFNICRAQNQYFLSDSIKAVDLNRSAIQLYREGLYTQALDSFSLSLELRKKIWGAKSQKLASTYTGMGILYGRLGQYDLALQNYDLAESNYLMTENIPARSLVALYNGIGTIYRYKLDYSKALQYYKQALSLSFNQLQSSPEQIAGINYSIAEIYYLTNNYDQAIITINNNFDNAYLEDQLLFLELLAFINQQKNNYSESKKNYQQLIELTTNLYGNDDIDVANAYVNYANFLISINEFQEAQKSLVKASDIFKKSQITNGQILSEYYKIEGFLLSNKPVSDQDIKDYKKRNLESSTGFYLKALKALNFPEKVTLATEVEVDKLISVTSSIENLKLIADNYNDLSILEQNTKDPVFNQYMAKAIETYQIIGNVIQQARKQLSDDQSKIQLTELEYSTFQKIIQISYSAYAITNDNKYLEIAFQNTERIKSSSVFDQISNQLAMDNSVIPDSLLNLESKLNHTIAIYSNKIYNETNNQNPDSSKINEYNNQIFTATKKRDELNRFMESEYSDFYELKYSNSMLSLYEIQNKLNEDQLIVEFVLNEIENQSELYTFVIGKKDVVFQKLLIDQEFDNHIENMFQFMSSNEYMFTKNADSKQFCVSSNKLYNQLILPVQNLIENKKLTIVPDGKLSYLPFDALLTTLPDTSKTIEFNKLDYLIREICINYSNSANLFFSKKTVNNKNSSKVLAFAPEYKEGETVEIGQKSYPLFSLPGIQEEVSQISKSIDSKIFIGESATEENFRKNAEDFEILHLAMHAFINDSLPAFSSFAFTQTPDEDPAKNGLLTTTDIYSLKLNAEMAVLSACNTGTGQLKKGEGIMSLARGFLYAGCPTIVMSLWEVEDESGTQIMSSFYKNIKKGKDKDESLRLAKLEYLETVNSRRAHPHYWLSFVSIGDNTAMYVSYDFYFFILLILALAGIGIDQGIRIKKARRKRAS